MEKHVVPPAEPSDASRMVGIEGIVHHVCLMRGPELVVTYHQGPKPPSEYISYAGVFRADDALDDMYAHAEPPTHDAWHHQSLEYPQSTFVRTTFQRIKEAAEGLLDLSGGTRGSSAQVALGAASTAFSSLIGGAWGLGGATDYGRPADVRPNPVLSGGGAPAGRRNGSTSSTEGGGSGGRAAPSREPAGRRPRVDYVGDPYPDERSGSAVIVQPFKLPVAIRQQVHAELAVALRGGEARETDPPQGADMPQLRGWEDASGVLFSDASHVIQGGDDAVWRAIVHPATDTMTEISIIAQAAEAIG